MFSVTNSWAQNISNEGTNFWAVFPTHVPSGNGNSPIPYANIAIFITAKSNSKVTVTCGSWSSGLTDIPANTAVQIDVPRLNAYVNDFEQNTVLTNRGIHVKVEEGKPKVSAYAHIYAGARSAATLILPFETLSRDYYSVNYTQVSPNGTNFLALVAVEDNTSLIIHPEIGAQINVTLPKAGDVYQYVAGANDLTGTYVETDPENSKCKRFAVFSGTSNTVIGTRNGLSGSDPLFQQVYPVLSLGKTYGIVPFINQSYFYRVVATSDDTKIYQDGNLVSTLNKGKSYESPRLIKGAYVTGNNNFLLSQYMYSSNNASFDGSDAGYGDPDMVLLNSIEFNINNITVFSSDKEVIHEKYLNVLMKTSQTSTFKINNIKPSVSWTSLDGNPLYAYAQIPVNEASLTLSANDGFNAIAYGYGQKESYAYSAGTNLASNNFLTVVNTAKNDESPNACIGTTSEFKISLPYQAETLLWKLDSEPEIFQTSPQLLETKVVSGQTLYVYSSPYTQTYTEKGDHVMEVTAHVTNNEVSCNETGDQTIRYAFSVYDLPTAKFEIAEKGCEKNGVSFTDQSESNNPDFAVSHWFWDFGDGTTSDEQNPTHTYEREGMYTVTLSVKAGTGCFSDIVESKSIIIYPLPVAKFKANTKTCIQTNLIIEDQSTISSALNPNSIVKWSYDFGDGTEVLERTDASTFSHQYQRAGKYTIQLTETSSNGCISEVFSFDVEVTDLPVADFTLPDVCLDDTYAVFTNTSVYASGNLDNFTYHWDFGDALNNQTTNTSTEKEGKHHYGVAGQYHVVLTITNENGCVSVKEQDFVVNGAVTQADFIVKDEANLCSNKDVIINNQSTVGFGKITRVVIYKDFINDPTTSEEVLNPGNLDIPLKYTSFGGNSNKQFTIRMEAYSGTNCFLVKDKVITIKPSAQLVFNAIPNVCQNDGSVVINQASETSGIAGVGAYSGVGVDAAGNFNPKNLTPGLKTITYSYTPNNGCAASITQEVLVYASPTVDAGAVLYVFAGGFLKIPAVASGNNLRYKWIPSTGLSNDAILNPIVTPQKDTKYTLEVTTSDGCMATAVLNVVVLEKINPPNAFSPNGDNVNDVWEIKYLNSYPNVTVEVFNRNGTRVFFSKGYTTPFDGNFQNEPLPVGVYYYLVSPGNGVKPIGGSLTILR
ncbi:PKD domain-containing protein [Pedobacter sp. MW01-1-1]|uniref:PKD domain-containing protein n=1 Tax=Pedobacter sp. MW01-1-1 TaxID=3383027 RepID=UPI003FED60A5